MASRPPKGKKGQKQVSQGPDTTEGKSSKKKQFGEYHEFQSLNPLPPTVAEASDEGEGPEVGVVSAVAGFGGGKKMSGRPSVSGSEQGVEVEGNVAGDGASKGGKEKKRKLSFFKRKDEKLQWEEREAEMKKEMEAELRKRVAGMEAEKQQWKEEKEARMKEQLDKENKKMKDEKLQWEKEKEAKMMKEMEAEKQQWKEVKEADMKEQLDENVKDEKLQWEKKREAELKGQMEAELDRRVTDVEAEKQRWKEVKEADMKEQLDEDKKKVKDENLQWEKEREAEMKKEMEAELERRVEMEKQQWQEEKEADMKKLLDEDKKKVEDEKLQWEERETKMKEMEAELERRVADEEAERQQWKKEKEAHMKEQLDEDTKKMEDEKLRWEKKREDEMKKEMEAELERRVAHSEAEKIEWKKGMKEQLEADLKREVEAERLIWMEEKEAEIKKQLQGEMEAEKIEWEEEKKAEMKREEESLKMQTDSKIAEVKKRHDSFLSLKSKEIQAKESEIRALKEKIKELSEAVESREEMKQRVLNLGMENRELQQEFEDRHKKNLEEIHKQHQQQLQQLEKELSRQYKEEAAAHCQERMRKLEEEKESLIKRLAAVEHELAVASQARGGATQESQLKREDLEKDLERAREELKKEAAERREVDQMYLNLTNSCKEARGRIQELEQELKFKEESLTQLQAKFEESRQPQVQVDGVTPPADDLHQRCEVLVKENQELRLQLSHPVPSNVYHFSHQLTKFVDPEGESAETNPRPLPPEAVLPFLQSIGVCGQEYKPRGYVLAVFHAFNQSQSTLLDFTKIGEVVQLKGHAEHLDASEAAEEIEKSPYSSLNDVKVEVTEGNMTDADKWDLQQMLKESQEELEKLRAENKSLLERLGEKRDDEKDAEKDAENAGLQAAPISSSEESKFQRMRNKYLLVHDEKMRLLDEREKFLNERQELLEKLEERDAQLMKLRRETLVRGNRRSSDHPDVERSLSVGDLMSPDDPKAEVVRLRKVVDDQDKKIHNLEVQLKSFEAVASSKANLEEEIAKLKGQLESSRAEVSSKASFEDEIAVLKRASQVEVKRSINSSELAQVYRTLSTEMQEARQKLRMSESEKQDLDEEKSILEAEASAAREDNQKLQSEIDKLQAALKFYEAKYPQDGTAAENLDNNVMDRELTEKLHKIEVTDLLTRLRKKEATIENMAKCRMTLEKRMLRLNEERDRLADHVLNLTAVKANLKGELSRYDQFKHSVEEMKEYATQLQKSLTVKMAEAESWKREREMMMQEIKDLQDEIEVRKHEVAVVRDDFQIERKEREKMASATEDRFGKWKVQEQQYQEDLQSLELRIKHLKHESDQREMKLTIKLEEKTKETIEWCDRLRTERNRYKDEREGLAAELNRVATLYENQKHKHAKELNALVIEKQLIESKRDDMEKDLEKELELKEATIKSLEQYITEEDEKKKQQFELLTKEKEAERRKLEGSQARISKEVVSLKQELSETQTRAEVFREKLQEQKQKVQHFKQQLQLSQEMLHRKEDEFKDKVDYIKAQCESEKVDQERLMIPLRRELEQLRSQKYSEGQFSETYRRMDAERKTLRQELEDVREKYGSLLDEFADARKLLLQHNIPFAQTKMDHQPASDHEFQRQPNIVPQPIIYANPGDYLVRPYVEQQQQQHYPSTSDSGNYNRGTFRHLGDNYNARQQQQQHQQQQLQQQTSRTGEVWRKQAQASPHQLPHTNPVDQASNMYSNIPQDSYQQQKKLASKAAYLDKRGSSLEYYDNQAPPTSASGPGMGVIQEQGGAYQQSGVGVPQVGVVSQCPAYNQQQQPPYQPQQPHSPQLHPLRQQQQFPPSHSPLAHQPPTNAQSHDPAATTPRLRQDPQYQPPSTNAPGPTPSSRKSRPLNPSAPQENVLMKDIDADISEAAADVRREVGVLTSITSVEGTPSVGEEPPLSLPLDSNLVCPMCKRQFRIGQIQHYRSHVDSCQGGQ